MESNGSDVYLENEDDVVEVININRIDSLLAFDERLEDEIDILSMTSLRSILLGQTKSCLDTDSNFCDDDSKLNRLSLAYERLHSIPKILLNEMAYSVKILDISHNEFDNLDFLCEFKQLTNLICDHNNVNATTVIPFMPNLELLWMNHCKINSLYPWAKKLQWSCPNLKYLSLMGNSVAPSYLNGGNFYEYLQYRFFIISLFPKLLHLDDRPVNEEQRREAEKMYHIPLMERFVHKTQATLPVYLRQFSDVFNEILTSTPSFVVPEKNLIV